MSIRNTNFIKKAHFLEANDELDEKDLDLIIDELEKIDNKKEKKEHFAQYAQFTFFFEKN